MIFNDNDKENREKREGRRLEGDETKKMGGGDERRKEKKGRTFTYTESDGENFERPTIRVFKLI
jgi:hypothetical protein